MAGAGDAVRMADVEETARLAFVRVEPSLADAVAGSVSEEMVDEVATAAAEEKVEPVAVAAWSLFSQPRLALLLWRLPHRPSM